MFLANRRYFVLFVVALVDFMGSVLPFSKDRLLLLFLLLFHCLVLGFYDSGYGLDSSQIQVENARLRIHVYPGLEWKINVIWELYR